MKNSLFFLSVLLFVSCANQTGIDLSKVEYKEFLKGENTPGGEQLDLYVVTPKMYSRDTIEAISKKLRLDFSSDNKMVLWFHLNDYSNTDPYANYAYLPKCGECELVDGQHIKYLRIK